MKIILSRKGFDIKYGQQPSPIIGDKVPLSMPIPMKEEDKTFGELRYKEHTYFQLIKSLKPTTYLTASDTCHLDPDIRKTNSHKNWKPLFGQSDSALSHLIKNEIGENDLVLFFGTFRRTTEIDGQIKYLKGAPEIHLIYGYFQVKKLHTDRGYLVANFGYHPHSKGSFTSRNLNGIYEANEKLSFNENLSGAGVFTYDDELILTKPNYSKSRWKRLDFFKDSKMTYHSRKSLKSDYFQSAAIGQEFIISDSNGAISWAKNLINRFSC
jgi:hypothetical protein